jgi:hypothetical protein
MKPMSKNGSSTGTAPKKARRRPRWLGPVLDDPMYRRMRQTLIREIAPETVLEWRAPSERPRTVVRLVPCVWLLTAVPPPDD